MIKVQMVRHGGGSVAVRRWWWRQVRGELSRVTITDSRRRSRGGRHLDHRLSMGKVEGANRAEGGGGGKTVDGDDGSPRSNRDGHMAIAQRSHLRATLLGLQGGGSRNGSSNRIKPHCFHVDFLYPKFKGDYCVSTRFYLLFFNFTILPLRFKNKVEFYPYSGMRC
jgi:hypothetical protein